MTSWMQRGHQAVITGGASGIGLATARRLRAAGLDLLLADLNEDALKEAQAALTAEAGAGVVRIQPCDVSNEEDVDALREAAFAHGPVHCLMNNAGAGIRTPSPWADLEAWKRQLKINLWGVIHCCHAFLPAMLEGGEPGVVINTGSKQGITNPPGNGAYNLSKAGVKSYTESLAHALRQEENCALTAHLLIPGFTYTGMIARFIPEKPSGAWTAEQVADFLLERLAAGDFYVLCPDNETPRELDVKRMAWNLGDITENRSALSRWDPTFEDAFKAFMDQT